MTLRVRKREFFSADTSQGVFCAPESLVFRKLGEPETREQGVFLEKDRMAKVSGRMASGHECWAFVTVEGMIAAYFWFSPGGMRIEEKAFDIRLAPKAGYVWDCFTAPGYRGQGLYTAGLRNLLHGARERGFRKLHICCDPANEKSRSGIVSAGFKKESTVVFFVVAGITVYNGPQGIRVGVKKTEHVLNDV